MENRLEKSVEMEMGVQRGFMEIIAKLVVLDSLYTYGMSSRPENDLGNCLLLTSLSFLGTSRGSPRARSPKGCKAWNHP